MIIHAVVLDDKVLRVEMLGRDPVVKVEHFFGWSSVTRRTSRWCQAGASPGTVDRPRKAAKATPVRGDPHPRSPMARARREPIAANISSAGGVLDRGGHVKLEMLPELPEGAASVL